MISNKRLTWSDGSGNWGVYGVDLGEQSPRVYAALYKLHEMENLVEAIVSPDIADYAAEEFLAELLGERRALAHEHDGR